jgi:DNA-binding IclR family transcriptional regulator
MILKALGAGAPRLGVSEIAERLGLAKTTVHGLLRTLEHQDLVEQDAETGKYRLGPAMLQLGNAFLDHHELRGRSLLWADALATRVGEAVRVGVLHGRQVLVVHHVFRPDDSVQILEVGASLPWHASALGKAQVASLTSDQRRSMLAGPLPRLTGRTISDPHELALELDGISAASGLATEDQEAVIGEAEVAAPVFDHRRHAIGAIGVAGPAERVLATRTLEEVSAAVLDAARRLSWEMGARRPASGSNGRGVRVAGR